VHIKKNTADPFQSNFVFF